MQADFRGGTSRMGEGRDANQRALAVVTAVAERLGATPGQVALAWPLEQGRRLGVSTVPIPGSRRSSRMIENLGCVDVRLDDDAMADLDGVAALVHSDRNIIPDPGWISSGRE